MVHGPVPTWRTALDERDGLLKQISGEIGITTLTRGDNDMVVFAQSGVTLFEGSARTVSFTPTSAFSAGTSGNQVYVDGVPLTHDTFQQPYGTGRLSGLLQLRDQIAPDYQNQLDEIARSLVSMFAEKDQITAADTADSAGPVHLCWCSGNAGRWNNCSRHSWNDQGFVSIHIERRGKSRAAS